MSYSEKVLSSALHLAEYNTELGKLNDVHNVKNIMSTWPRMTATDPPQAQSIAQHVVRSNPLSMLEHAILVERQALTNSTN